MTKPTKPTRSPSKFVGLHSHSTLSIGDAIGLPQDHIDFAIENGSDALALTDHGNMNGYSHQYLHAVKLKEKGVNFKAIPGIEAYFIPSLEDWKKLYEARQVEKAQQKVEKEALKKSKARPKTVEELANQYADVEEEISGAKEVDDEDEGGTVVENEEETKRNKPRDPLMRRSHLVLLAKNSEGLKSLFQLVSDSYIDGFYRYPRMDFDNLKKYAKGNIVATSACISGDALLETNFGILSLAETVEKLNQGAEIFVLSYNESTSRIAFERVVWGKKTKQNVKVLKVRLADGSYVKATGDHKFLTDKGWLRADQLKENMPLRILTSNT